MFEQCWVSDEYSRNSSGYMQVWWEGRQEGAHRLSFYLHHGYWPRTARHTCDNRACYNPTHILDGTPGDNVRDMYSRGRESRRWGNSYTLRNYNMPDQRINKSAYMREMRRRKKEGTWNARTTEPTSK